MLLAHGVRRTLLLILQFIRITRRRPQGSGSRLCIITVRHTIHKQGPQRRLQQPHLPIIRWFLLRTRQSSAAVRNTGRYQWRFLVTVAVVESVSEENQATGIGPNKDRIAVSNFDSSIIARPPYEHQPLRCGSPADPIL